MRRIALLLAGACLVSPAIAADGTSLLPDKALETAALLRDQGLQDNLAYEITEQLSTQVGPRLAGGPNDLKAREWMIAKFKELGFDEVWTEPVTFPKWERRSESAQVTAPWPQPLAVTALGNSAATPANGLHSELVILDDWQALQDAPAELLQGKIVYMAIARMDTEPSGRSYGIGSRVRSLGPSVAASKGASGFMMRSVGSDNNRTPHTGMTRFEDGVEPIPAAAISNPDADLIEVMRKSGEPIHVSLQLDVGMAGEYTGANVIAQFNGREKPEEYFLTGGHLDSWDLSTGALDDAVGIGITTAAAHIVAQLPERPRRSIRVVAFANEESGLFGGHAYGKRHRDEISRAVLGTESDAGADRIIHMAATVHPRARPVLQQIADVLAPLGISYDPAAPGSGGSDLSAIHAVGMAGLSLYQDTSRYFLWHHTANDTMDKVDLDQVRQNVAAYAAVIYMAAESEVDFGSAPGAFSSDD